MQTESKIPVSFYIEETPNPNSLKFVSNIKLMEGAGIEFVFLQEAKYSPLAQELFKFPFVKSMFFAQSFITILKKDEFETLEVTIPLRDFLTDYFQNSKPVFAQQIITQKSEIIEDAEVEDVLTNELDIKIVQILDEYIKPAVESDGGAIVFKSFKNGIVTVSLQGSCRGCPSSTMTLKAGIEGLLKRLMPEVESVVAE
jgi:NFU1 iron-sulfur cluster scaffold homolog, mitochondrial